MFFRMMIAAISIFTGTPSLAEALSKEPDFKCVKAVDLAGISGEVGKALINNLNINEAPSFMTASLYELRFSYAVANRNDLPVYASVDAIFEDKNGQPIAAISASPPFGSVAAGKTEAIERATIINQGSIGMIDTICVRMAGAIATR